MATDFFERQDAARRNTTWLVLCFVVCVLLIIAAVYLPFAVIFQHTQVSELRPGPPPSLWNPELFYVVAVATLGVVLAGSAWKLIWLSGGGRAVAEMLGGRPVDPATADPDERRVLNVVEEMAIASGTPVPSVFLLEHEPGINAFAAGFTPGDAVIGVTRGTTKHLSRDELQGVVAHEFSHIFHGDMRLNLRLMAVLNGILLITVIGYHLMYSAGRSSGRSGRHKGEGGLVLLGLALCIIGYIGVFFGKLIKSAVSRQREFLADASAVQFTRNPSGLAGALKKIGGLMSGSRIEHPSAEEASHLFFGNGLGRLFAAWMSTHPPLVERIRRLDPGFDGRFPDVESIGVALPGELESAEQRAAADRIAERGRRGALVPEKIELAEDEATGLIGAPNWEHIAYAAALVATLPEPLKVACHEPFAARAVIFALLLDKDPQVRQKQLALLAKHSDPATYQQTLRSAPLVESAGDEARIPLVDMAIPALGQLSPAQFAAFKDNLDRLVKADQRVGLFEYVLVRTLLRHFAQQFGRRPPPAARHRSIKPLRYPTSVLLSALAYVGHEDAAGVRRAFEHGAKRLGVPIAELALLAKDQCVLETLDESLDMLAAAAPAVKKRVLEAASACIAADERVTVTEAELLRAVADSLDCPIPPLLAGK